MGRHKGSGKKQKEEAVLNNEKISKTFIDDVVKKYVEAKADGIEKEIMNLIEPRRNIRGEFEQVIPRPAIARPAEFICYDGHITMGASSYVKVPCRICNMESVLKSIQKEVSL